MEYIIPRFRITTFMNMAEPDIMEARLVQLVALEEDQFVANFYQQVQKARKKAWHDRNIWKNTFSEGELILLYDSKTSEEVPTTLARAL